MAKPDRCLIFSVGTSLYVAPFRHSQFDQPLDTSNLLSED